MSGQHQRTTTLSQIKKNIFLYRKFSFTQNQKLCKFFDLWAFFLRKYLSCQTSFQKRFLLILHNRKSLWKVPNKNTILRTKGDISSQGQNSLSTPSFPDLGASSQKKCLCISICTTLIPVSGLMFCIKRCIEHTCWNCRYAAFLRIQYRAFQIGSLCSF